MAKHNLIFDFDGVLGDTYEKGIEVRMITNNIHTREEAIFDLENYITKKPYHTRNHTLTDEELKTSYTWVSNYGEMLHQKGFGLFEDIIEEVRKLADDNKAIVSSGSQTYVLPAIAKTGINFSHILAYEDHHSKEEKIELVCKDWGVSVTDVYYFTDTLADVYELKDLIHKDKLIGVSWGYCTKTQLLTELPLANILSLPTDLSKIISR